MMIRAASAIAAIALASCASTITPAVQSRLATAARDAPVACGACRTEWERAQLWLLSHSNWKLQLANDIVLQTFNPPNHDVSYGFTVTKSPRAAGDYVIAMQLACGNSLGCDPLPGDVRRAFYHYVTTGQDLLAGMGYLGSIR